MVSSQGSMRVWFVPCPAIPRAMMTHDFLDTVSHNSMRLRQLAQCCPEPLAQQVRSWFHSLKPASSPHASRKRMRNESSSIAHPHALGLLPHALGIACTRWRFTWSRWHWWRNGDLSRKRWGIGKPWFKRLGRSPSWKRRCRRSRWFSSGRRHQRHRWINFSIWRFRIHYRP